MCNFTVFTSIPRFVEILYLHVEMSMCACAQNSDTGRQVHMLISMCEYKILPNLGMLVNARFLPVCCPAHH